MQNLLKINENKQKIENLFVIYIIVSIVSSPTKKTDQNEFNAIQDLLQCSRSSAYRQQKRASTKLGHLIAQVKNTAVKCPRFLEAVFVDNMHLTCYIEVSPEWH